jgi:streptogramin lyase
MTEFPVTGGPTGITTGPDGNLWFVEFHGNAIGRMTTSGSLTVFPLRTTSTGSFATQITAGPDGNLWFSESAFDAIGRISPNGTITEFALPSPNALPTGIATGPDGNLWFVETFAGKLGRITPSGSFLPELPLPSGTSSLGPITTGPDGNIWISAVSPNQLGEIGKMTPSGAITWYALPSPVRYCAAITAGPDGNVWFTETDANSVSRVGRITPGGILTEFTTPTTNSGPGGIVAGPDGNLWFTEELGNEIGQVVLDKPLTASGKALTATEGVTFTGVVASFTDADPGTPIGSYTASITWGDGSTSAGTITTNAGVGFNVTGTHTFAEEGSAAVMVTITDEDTRNDVGGATATVTSPTTIADAPLSAQGATLRATPATGSVVVATFQDAGGAEPVSSYTATIDWGDGSRPSSGKVTLSGKHFSVSGSHTYALTGTYTLKVSIHDEGGSTAAVTSTATIATIYPLVPLQVRHAYAFDKLPLARNDGTGQTIAIVDAYDDPNVFQDLDTFDKTYGVISGQSLYQQYGASSQFLTLATPEGQPSPDANWAEEISLDVQWAHAIAPGAHILLVEAISNSGSDLLTAVDYAANHGAAVVSMSWGADEFPQENQYDSYFTQPGVTYVASAGDVGSVVSWPAVSPNVLSVGGTALKVNLAGTYGGETGWSSGGGGVSSYEAKPGYQQNVPQSSSKRTTPDVAYDGDPATGVSVYDSYGGLGGWLQVGGTSAGAPQWAALIAVADQGRSSPLGSLATLNALYALLSQTNTINSTYLHDVTHGSSGLYSAGPGYDLVTGLGSPRADQLIPYLRGASSGVRLGASGHPSTKPPVKVQPLNASLAAGSSLPESLAIVLASAAVGHVSGARLGPEVDAAGRIEVAQDFALDKPSMPAGWQQLSTRYFAEAGEISGSFARPVAHGSHTGLFAAEEKDSLGETWLHVPDVGLASL